MGFNEEERQSTPPPWGWPSAAEEKAHGVGEIVYHGAAKPTMHTKDRRHEQEKVYHKTRSRATPHGQAARDAGHGMERIREPLRADIAAALREGPQHPVLHVAAGAQARKALPVIRSVTTDNGCEFLDQKRLDRVFKAETYYTRAYASYEKGAIENCNRLVRRWYPKGTDFNQLTRRQIRQLEDWINSIHRESLNGETAYAYDSRMAQAA